MRVTGAMADQDTAKLEELLAGITVDDAGLQALLAGLAGVKTGRTDPDDVPEPPEEPYVKPGELYVLGDHRLLCGDAMNPADVARLLDGATPTLLSTDPPYGVSLDPTWRDGVYNQMGPAEQPYMRTQGHRNTTLSGDTVADWSEAFALVPSLEVGYVWHAGVHAAAVADGLVRIGFEIVAQVIWDKGLFAMGRSWYQSSSACDATTTKSTATPRWSRVRRRAPYPLMSGSYSRPRRVEPPAQNEAEALAVPASSAMAGHSDPTPKGPCTMNGSWPLTNGSFLTKGKPMVSTGCAQPMPDGRRCRAPLLRDSTFCFWHDPDKAEEAAEARKLGGHRRRRERTLAVAYDLAGLGSIEAIRRIIEIALFDVLGLDNSIARARVLITGALAAAKLLETGELAERIAALEAALADRTVPPESLFPDEPAA